MTYSAILPVPDEGGPFEAPTKDGLWVVNDAGWFGPYETDDLRMLDQPSDDETLVEVAGADRTNLGPLATTIALAAYGPPCPHVAADGYRCPYTAAGCENHDRKETP